MRAHRFNLILTSIMWYQTNPHDGGGWDFGWDFESGQRWSARQLEWQRLNWGYVPDDTDTTPSRDPKVMRLTQGQDSIEHRIAARITLVVLNCINCLNST